MDVLNERVLVLNKNFYALCVIDVKEAFRLVTSDKALIMDENYISHDLDSWHTYSDPEKHKVVRTVNCAFAIPQVIRLISFDKIVEYTLSVSRQNVFTRDNYICQYCRAQMAKEKLTIDHVIPRSRREEFKLSPQEINGWENVVTSCQICNSTKDNKTPDEANMPLAKLPAKPKHTLSGFELKHIKPLWKLYLQMEV